MLCPPELRAPWRRGRDSNPGQSFWPCNRLAGGCLRPTRPPLRVENPCSIRDIPRRYQRPRREGAAREVAEGEGFEPPIPFRGCPLSRRLASTGIGPPPRRTTSRARPAIIGHLNLPTLTPQSG